MKGEEIKETLKKGGGERPAKHWSRAQNPLGIESGLFSKKKARFVQGKRGAGLSLSKNELYGSFFKTIPSSKKEGT